MINNSLPGKILFVALILSGSILCAQNTPAPKALVPPKALRPDIKVEHFIAVAPKSVRILYDDSTGDAFFTCYDGDVYQIKDLQGRNPKAVMILSVKDHGIPRLQGAAVYKNSLFLTGNTKVNNGLGNKGRMVRYDLKTDQEPAISVVFNTVEYGTTRTVFDHGWNALEISPDGKYIFVNSGARTDHGEVQDNDGAWPNARNGALTARVFRFPINSKDLVLPDDEAKLKADGYIYADGIRNAYDLAFDGAGNLFGVSNSSDYDHNEDMFWIREGRHYGFPWIIGGIENPQQYPDWIPNPDTDPFIPRSAHAWAVRYFKNDPNFPKIPEGVKFSPGVQNIGPDANEYRGHSGKIMDGDQTGVTVSTFTPHSSPLALIFDKKNTLSKDFNGDGFTIRYSLGARSSMMKPFTNKGADMLHLDLSYDKMTDNYFVKTTSIVEGFNSATDAILVGNTAYVIEYGAMGGNIWKVIFPK